MLSSPIRAFTSTYPSLSKKLINEAVVGYNKQELTVRAQWDTGATTTCISKDVVSHLNLIPIGSRQISTPSGSSVVNTYILDIKLLNNVTIPQLIVCETEIGDQGIGLLVGMDIIGLGDFAVSNWGGKTIFTFRTPSQRITDYAKQLSVQNVIGSLHGKKHRK